MFVLSLVVVFLMVVLSGGVVGKCSGEQCSVPADARIAGDRFEFSGTPTQGTTPSEISAEIKGKELKPRKGDMNYYDETKTSEEITTEEYRDEQGDTMRNQDLTTELMLSAGNLKDTWDNIPDTKRQEFVKQQGAKAGRELTGKQLTLTNELRDLLRSEQGKEAWNSLPRNEKNNAAIQMGYPINPSSDLTGWEWTGEHTLQLKDKSNIIDMINMGNRDLTFLEDGKILSKGPNGETYFKGGVEYSLNPPGTPSPQYAQGQSAGKDKGLLNEFFNEVFPMIEKILSGIDKNSKTGSNGIGQGSVYGDHNSGINLGMEGGREFLQETDDKIIGTAQNNPDEKATINIDKDAKNLKATNAILATNQGADIYTQQETDVHLEGTPDNAFAASQETSETFSTTGTPTTPTSNTVTTTPSAILPIIPKSITAQAIFNEEQINLGQYIKLIEHNVDMSGKDITVDILKSFSKAEAGGQNLRVYSGDIQIRFENQKILYPRLIKNAPYGISEISNKLDRNNKFKLQHYTTQKSQLTDNKQITSVTDLTAKHPTKELLISKIRKPMWKTKK